MAFLVLAAGLLMAQAQAPDIPVPQLKAPSQVAAAPTPAEMQTLRAGYAFFQQQRFDDAIAKYKEVLDANPKSAATMHEIALAMLQKKDFAGTIEMELRAADFESSELANIYGLIGSTFDMMGQPKKDAAAGLATLKRGAYAAPAHAPTQLMLAQYFLSKGLKTPAVLALARMLIAEPSSSRTIGAYRSWYGTLTGGVKPGANNGPAQIGVNPNQSKEEGDLLQFDLYISLSQINAAAMPEGTPVPERLVTQMDQLLTMWTAKDPKDDEATTFLWTYYIPYFKELRDKKFVRPFVYYISQNVGMAGAREWIASHGDEIQAFVAWNKTFQFKAAPPR